MRIGDDNYLSAMDIAEYIAYPGAPDGVAKAMRQVRHWTQNDLLRTVTPKHVGRGKSRLYLEEPTIYIAFVLLELSRYGITVDKMKPLSDLMYEEFDGGDSWDIFFAILTDDWNGYIRIDWNIDPVTGVFGDPDITMFNDGMRQREPIEKVALPEASSSTIIHVNKVMDRYWHRYKQLNPDPYAP